MDDTVVEEFEVLANVWDKARGRVRVSKHVLRTMQADIKRLVEPYDKEVAVHMVAFEDLQTDVIAHLVTTLPIARDLSDPFQELQFTIVDEESQHIFPEDEDDPDDDPLNDLDELDF